MSAGATDAELRARFATLDTPAVSDALDSLGINGQCVGLLPTVADVAMAGPAFTVRMLPVGESGKPVGDYIDDVPVGAVVVIDNLGRLDVTVWGDLLTVASVRNGIAGVVIDGACRDTTVIARSELPVYARGRTMRTGKDRVAAESYNGPVQLAGVRVEAGDWVVGDRDGVVVVPRAYCAEVLAVAAAISATEDSIRGAVDQGRRLDDIRRETSYHRLQRRADDSVQGR